MLAQTEEIDVFHDHELAIFSENSVVYKICRVVEIAFGK
jgi:hypothetical protein